jgi:hypothetical protein
MIIGIAVEGRTISQRSVAADFAAAGLSGVMTG